MLVHPALGHVTNSVWCPLLLDKITSINLFLFFDLHAVVNTCDGDFYPTNFYGTVDTCYHIGVNKIKHSDAVNYCSDKNSHLVVIESRDEQLAFNSFVDFLGLTCLLVCINVPVQFMQAI